MGNSNCSLGIQTEKNAYFSGDTVRGRVYLSVNDENGIIAKTLNVHCSGSERAVVHYSTDHYHTDNNGRDHHHSRDNYEQNEIQILNFDVPIHTPIGSLFQFGQYEFPFQFVIPQNLPSTMYCKDGQSRCEIRYEMNAYLSKTDRSTTSFINPFNSKNNIRSRPMVLTIFGNDSVSNPYHNQPISLPADHFEIYSCCCCIRQGKMELSASIDSGLFIPNQSRVLSFNLKNHSKVDVKEVRIEVIEKVSWRPRFRDNTINFTMAKQVFNGNLNAEWRSNRPNFHDYVSLFPTSGSNTVGSQHVNLSIPHNSRDTYSGRMIQVDHYVRIKVITPGCCRSNPESTVDIRVTRPSQMITLSDMPAPSAPIMDDNQTLPEAVALPPNWSPQTCDVVTLPIATVISVTDSFEAGHSQDAWSKSEADHQSSQVVSSQLPSPSAPLMDDSGDESSIV
mmetsp:Transcript_9428/g.11927  ORF Transcript_9428/g.11927 Transcript_9428/m.11927 type:complete len:449 (-) Transcript_9428:97-1443(-)